MNRIIFVTCTFQRPGQIQFIKRHVDTLISKIDNYAWIIVEDGSELNQEIQLMIKPYQTHYFCIGPTRDKGHVQRNLAFEYIRDVRMDGVVYNMDDDNLVHPGMSYDLRTVSRLAVFPVGNLGPNRIERPIIEGQKFVRWDAGWESRKYPVDMGGFAFPSHLLFDRSSPIWPVPPTYRGVGGESEFIDTLISSRDEIDFSLCHWNKICLVFHNEPL